MTKWIIDYHCKKIPKLKSSILIEGLPGIGNVGKVTVDFMIDELNAVKLLEIFSYSFPHSVFIGEENLAELPSISLYYKKMPGKNNDLLFLAGDIQPVEDVACYEFCDKILDIVNKIGTEEIVTLGGIGLNEIPEKPKVYVTGNNKDVIKRYANGSKVITKLYGVVGPIIGVSGVLIGLSKRKNIDAVAMLAETFGHPMYIGMKGAREILKILIKKNSLKINMKELNKEINRIEKDVMKKNEDMYSVKKQTAMQKLKGVNEENSYIG